MFKFLIKTFLLAVIVTMNTNELNAYSPPEFTDQHRVSNLQRIFPKLDKMYHDYAEKNHIPGYAFGVMVDGKLVYSGAGGYSDIKKKTPNNMHSMFRIASVTKSVTAMAILKLRDEGKLQLDDPIYRYIPELKNQQLTRDAAVITLRDLLTHSAGFPTEDSWGDRHLNISNDEFMALIEKGISFANATGTSYEYSNLAYALLGLVINKVSGISYQEYIAKNIWQPLGMTNSSWEFSTIPANKLVQGYQWNGNSWIEEKLLSDGAFAAMGGMISSIDDFSHYVALFQTAWPPRDDPETGPIKRSSLREMQQAWRFNELNLQYQFLNGTPCAMTSAYGYGLRWLKDCEGRTFLGHSGGLPGFGSNWFILPDYGIGVILFANNTYAPAGEINLQVLDTLIKEAQLKPRQLLASSVLKNRKNALNKLLPDWKGAETSGLFADNFFLDVSLDARQKESNSLFKKIGKIIRVHELVPESQLRGYFIIEGEMANLKVYLSLTPQNPPLIQELKILQEELPVD